MRQTWDMTVPFADRRGSVYGTGHCTRSGGVFPPLSEAEHTFADADGVAVAQWSRPVDAAAVDVGAAGRARVLDEVLVAAADDAGVQPVHGAVAEQADVAVLG